MACAKKSCKKPMENSYRVIEGVRVNNGTIEGGYLFPCRDGVTYNGIRYSSHALERMAPDTPEMIELLLFRSFSSMEARFDELKTRSTLSGRSRVHPDWWKTCALKPRGILPKDVEDCMKFPETTLLEIKRSEDDVVITVYWKVCSESEAVVQANSKLEEYARKLENKRYTPPVLNTLQYRKRSSTEVAQACRIDRIISRRAIYVRSKALELTTKLETWEKENKAAKQEKRRIKVDIQAWKAENKKKAEQCKHEREIETLLV